MAQFTIELDDDLVEWLQQELDQPIDQAGREFVVLELYRRGLIPSGRAGAMLGMSRWDFIRYSGELGIPFFRQSVAELDAEIESARTAWRATE